MVYTTASYRILGAHKAKLNPGECKQKRYNRRMSEGHNSHGGDGEMICNGEGKATPEG